MIVIGDTSVLRCRHCTESATVVDLVLVKMNGVNFPKIGGRGSLPASYHRFCHCDMSRSRALAFFNGEVLRANDQFAELVRGSSVLYWYGRCHLPVHYGKTIRELLAEGKYRSPGLDVRDSNFPSEVFERDLGEVTLEFRIFQAKKAMEFEDVIVALYQENCRGASLRESLTFGNQKPHIHQKISLIAPGSFWRNPKVAYRFRQIPELCSISNTRHVYLHQLDSVFPAGTFFLTIAL